MPDSMAARILLGNLDGVEPDSMATHVLLGKLDGVEPDRSLHLTHADSPPCDVPPSPDISHPAPDAGWERRAFQLPRLDISGRRMGEEGISTSPVGHIRII